MRVVGGALRGRLLAAPSSQAIRPTSDRLREAVFNVLAHAHDDPVPGARVIDIFAGTGALGIEAMSRGAAFALFVDEGAAAQTLIRRNLEALGLRAATALLRRDATRLGPASMAPFSLALCDPPYGRALAGPALAACAAGGWLTAGALVVVEESAAAAVEWPPGFDALDRRRYGETAVALGRYRG